MDDRSPESLDPLQRLREIANPEVGQRKGIARATSADMYTNSRRFRVRLPALPLGVLSDLQLNAQKLCPEVSGASRIIGGKLDQGQRRRWHFPHDNRHVHRYTPNGILAP